MEMNSEISRGGNRLPSMVASRKSLSYHRTNSNIFRQKGCFITKKSHARALCPAWDFLWSAMEFFLFFQFFFQWCNA